MNCFRCDAPLSPDCNAIENTFGAVEWRLAKGHSKKRAINVTEWADRFEKTLKGLEDDGTIERTVRTFPKRMQEIINANGGPTGR